MNSRFVGWRESRRLTAVNGGIIEVKDDLLLLLGADSAERERDMLRAERAKQRRTWLEDNQIFDRIDEVQRAQAARRALNRIV